MSDSTTTTSTPDTAVDTDVKMSAIQKRALSQFTKAVEKVTEVENLAAKVAAQRVDSYMTRAVATRNLFETWGGRDKRGVQSDLARITGVKRPTLISWYDDSVLIEEKMGLAVEDFADFAKWSEKKKDEARAVIEEKFDLAAEAKKGYRLQKQEEKEKEARRKEREANGGGASSNGSAKVTVKGAVEQSVSDLSDVIEGVKALMDSTKVILSDDDAKPSEADLSALRDLLADFSTLVSEGSEAEAA